MFVISLFSCAAAVAWWAGSTAGQGLLDRLLSCKHLLPEFLNTFDPNGLDPSPHAKA